MWLFLLGIQGGFRGVIIPPSYFLYVYFYWFLFFIPRWNSNHRQQHTVKLEENILYNEIIYFHISLHPIQGYKLPSCNIEGAIQSFLLNTHFQKSNKLSLTNTYTFKLIRWRGSSLVATRFLKQESRVSKPAVSE